MSRETLELIDSGGHKKGDVLTVARIAGIQAAKQCSSLIPLCHPLMLSKVEVQVEVNHEQQRVDISATCKLNGQTGVEMEALTAVSVAALTIYDMCKAVDKEMVIGEICLQEKQGRSQRSLPKGSRRLMVGSAILRQVCAKPWAGKANNWNCRPE